MQAPEITLYELTKRTTRVTIAGHTMPGVCQGRQGAKWAYTKAWLPHEGFILLP
jgi:hypothetical protein